MSDRRSDRLKRRVCDCCGHAPCLAKANEKLRRTYRALVHAVFWHALDDSGDDGPEGTMTICKTDYDRLCKLVPEEHP